MGEPTNQLQTERQKTSKKTEEIHTFRSVEKRQTARAKGSKCPTRYADNPAAGKNCLGCQKDHVFHDQPKALPRGAKLVRITPSPLR
ncbi:hypothetical protein Psta_2552 [Pirellula staleyi DSM 6068]|uniref:Uncharacterized protein n=1 Tax=Pirellula staleyi (strain ATCC 27377 / DSM 6068 / ICPB 4128) TaxID=530564 RepID=D2R5N9_PIRSD|nr:hypothetical protein Psta_2552 [Pirellula staleyi DSM 6068]